ncbi:uncharacterized protein LOC114295307 [Camellia sinensis]|uniref:uncharacterized protein LOC114295307 n=1 Tax=Camellia sinensis TaxID=4442 RepID=UPI001035FC86|nr:uncharacterized protein LOC114295307 [Camellia sinensis]
MTEDTCTWMASNSGVFSVALAWKRLESINGPMLSISKFLWRNSTLPKAKFFSWLVWRGRIRTADFMHRIGALTANVSSLCVFCSAEVESINHVLLLCPLVWKLWSKMVNWWEIKWVTPGSVDVLLQWWVGMKFRKQELDIWKVVPLAMLWFVWKLMNDCLFNNDSADLTETMDLLKVRVVQWVKSNCKGINYSVHDTVANLKHVKGCLA